MRLTFVGLEGHLSVINGAQEDRYIVDIPFESVSDVSAAGGMRYVSAHPYMRDQVCRSVEEMVERKWLRHTGTIVLSRSRVIAQQLNEDDVTELVEWALEADSHLDNGLGLLEKFGGRA